ncbi:hypothetical protein PAECIP111893_04350 [Paenibacillus plantiphilus]|uniref:Spore coat protein CotH n=1 Tax=Paenibacillus plantiphilus TaxID=2905650 RepID=A0ABN8GTV9_9BACL|nr:CotH kinase family protein [Paenibacillus plantiphilus]CAH1218037.1 hypothetical protein PAECIP111893_04350 [Paenibacillus plantiphilus]
MKRYSTKLRAAALASTLFAAMLSATACMPSSNNNLPETEVVAPILYSPKLTENRMIYKDDKADSIAHLYITVTDSNLTAEEPIEWAELNRISLAAPSGEAKKMDIILQEGDQEGPRAGMLGFGSIYPNAVISLRGKSTLKAPQKSYKVDLSKNSGKWREQQTVNLIKHAYDFSRIRNKLSFDYFKTIPDFTSLRTQFVNLHVKDLTNGSISTEFADYGLYTQIEQPNKSFLRAHGLDPYGHLYKAANFEFLRYPDKLKLATDPTFDEAAFDSVLEPKGDTNHTKLLQMLDDLNNLSLDADQVFDRYFDRDNFLTWMAVNILMDNMDTITQNYMLYSPLNSEKFYFLPWDYDGGWGFHEQYGEEPNSRADWQTGLSNFWGSILQKRFFKNPANVEDLTKKISDLTEIINPDNTREMIESYKEIVKPFIQRQPDIEYLPGPVSAYEAELERIIGLTAVNEKRYLANLEKPMPIFLGEVKQAGRELTFNWDMSYDLQGDELSYSFQLAKEPSFLKPLASQKNLQTTSLTLKDIAKGRYYWRVVVSDSKGNEMKAFDSYEDENNNDYHGIRQFFVE